MRYFPGELASKPGMTATNSTPASSSSSTATTCRGAGRRDDLAGRAAPSARDIPHSLLPARAPGYRPDGNCRACMVEIEGERVLAASACGSPRLGMQVQHRDPSGPRRRARSSWSSSSPTSRHARRARTTRLRTSGARPTRWGVDGEPLPGGGALGAPTRATRRCASTSTPASSAASACAPAARCRSTT